MLNFGNKSFHKGRRAFAALTLLTILRIARGYPGRPHSATQAETAVKQQARQAVVRWFDEQKGLGFLGRDDGRDVFVHHTSIVMEGYRTLREGQRVEFILASGAKGDYAEHVTPLD